MKYFLIMNPGSHSSRSKKQFSKIFTAFKKYNLNYEYKYTSCMDDARLFAKNAVKDRFDVVVAVGGDGTICQVISGLLDANNSDFAAKLGVLHVGTSPDFNRYHNIPVKIEKAVELLAKMPIKKIDIGSVEYIGFGQTKEISYFGSNVNIGLGPIIANKANSRHRKYLGDFLGTLVAVIQTVFTFKGITLDVIKDNQKMDYGILFNLTIGKDPFLASGMRITNDILPDDGRLFIMGVKKDSILSILKNIPKLYKGNFLEYKNAFLEYCTHVKISSNENLAIEFDGDMRGFLPATIKVIPSILEVIS